MTEPSQRIALRIPSNSENLRALADMDLGKSQPQIVLTLTPEQYEQLPDRPDVRRALVNYCEKLGVEHTYTSDSLEEQLPYLLAAYNDDKPPVRFESTVDPDSLTLQQTVNLLNVVSACSDEEDRIRPWEAGTSVAEALQDHEMSPEEVFRQPAGQ